MSYTKIVAAELGFGPGQHPAASRFDKGVGEALGVRSFGIYQVELPPGDATVRHDHAEDGVEDVYAAIRGSGVVVVDNAEVSIEAGQFVAVSPESARHVRAGEEGLVFIAVCAAGAH